MNVDVAPDTAEAMDTSAIPTAEKRKPLSVRQSKAKRQKPKPPTQEKREIQEDPSTTTKPPKARRVRGKAKYPNTSIRSNNQHPPQRQQDTQCR